ncbi:Dual specificity tyrosine-phosphorylation-regulated kinase 3 [Tritrichomonas foetus]|uniref:dual-specificity kinase n=1 Tax=Tritrichomonas foetus TaxID=1144522 RepID=A0A1J4JYX9_9EUKA|nr:Dual specificity tyrosine-phosphorylation-regulated kinase 3 [Tritrichomonas foetus]|eukprot:OHT03688.1 Dual specificity tyrosine-phosphorylation-regulated kinase 3 [Tritrichomonas foetus]
MNSPRKPTLKVLSGAPRKIHSKSPAPTSPSTQITAKSKSNTPNKLIKNATTVSAPKAESATCFITKDDVDTGQFNSPGVVKGAPITPAFAKQRYREFLTTYENTEISNYKQIYFIGSTNKKVNGRGAASNFGFDSPTSYYKVQIGDHLAYRYEIVAIFGRGAFGEVVKCIDHKTKAIVAVKILVNTQLMHKQGAIEIANMQVVSKTKSPYIGQVTDSFTFRNHLCIVTEVLGNSLLKHMEIKDFAPFSTKQLKSVVYDITSGLVAIHQAGIIHADVKLENVLFLVGSTLHVKIIDFGSSCAIGNTTYNYLQSRFYRAPEIILGIKYGTPIDIWSLGCIVAELATGKPLFSGQNEADQLKKFVEVVGAPPAALMAQSPRKNQYTTSDGKIIGNPTPFKTRLSSVLKSNDQPMIDFITKCLEWDPTKRITAAKAIAHPWITKTRKA